MKGHFSAEDDLDLGKIGFKLAFGIYDLSSGKTDFDDTLVQWKVYLETMKDLKVVN